MDVAASAGGGRPRTLNNGRQPGGGRRDRRSTYVNQVAAGQGLVDTDARYYDLADMRFRNGVDTYLNILVAQNSLLSARLSLISLKLAQLQNSACYLAPIASLASCTTSGELP